MKNSNITVTDQFCGAGGSSQGVRMVAEEQKLGSGLEVTMAMNHWPLAIETHNTNFPNTRHACTDISASDPRRFPSTTILVASPECTVHSPAGGGQAKKKKHGNQLGTDGRLVSDVEEERSRATMWDVCRFTEYHRYEIVIVENVVEARKWICFDDWLRAMATLGYDHEIKFINSMHAHPTPQSRDRMYCVFWRRGNKKPDLNFNPVAHCGKCCKNVDAYQWWKPHKTRIGDFGKYKTQYLFKCPDCNEVVEPFFYAAFNCINWNEPGRRIGDRKPSLSPKTLTRCQYGVDKYWDEPSMVNVKFSSGVDFRVKPAGSEPLTTQPTDAAVGVLSPAIISSRYIQGIANRVKSSHDALPVQVTDGRESVMFPPQIIKNYGGNFDPANAPQEITDKLGTVTTTDHHGLMTPPLIMDGGWSDSKRVDIVTQDPLSTQDTGQTKGMLMPLVVDNYGQSKSRPATEALGSQTTKPKQGIITPQAFQSFISYYYGGSKMASHVTESMRALTTVEGSALVNKPYERPRLEDCYYRMLLPEEIQLGMAFAPDYIVLGNSKQKVKQLGNAVTPPVMKFLVKRCVDTLM